jgi:hypothetical protein
MRLILADGMRAHTGYARSGIRARMAPEFPCSSSVTKLRLWMELHRHSNMVGATMLFIGRYFTFIPTQVTAGFLYLSVRRSLRQSLRPSKHMGSSTLCQTFGLCCHFCIFFTAHMGYRGGAEFGQSVASVIVHF